MRCCETLHGFSILLHPLATHLGRTSAFDSNSRFAICVDKFVARSRVTCMYCWAGVGNLMHKLDRVVATGSRSLYVESAVDMGVRQPLYVDRVMPDTHLSPDLHVLKSHTIPNPNTYLPTVMKQTNGTPAGHRRDTRRRSKNTEGKIRAHSFARTTGHARHGHGTRNTISRLVDNSLPTSFLLNLCSLLPLCFKVLDPPASPCERIERANST